MYRIIIINSTVNNSYAIVQRVETQRVQNQGVNVVQFDIWLVLLCRLCQSKEAKVLQYAGLVSGQKGRISCSSRVSVSDSGVKQISLPQTQVSENVDLVKIAEFWSKKTQNYVSSNKTQVSSQDVVSLCLCVLISKKCYKKVSPFCTGLSIYNTYMRMNSPLLSHNNLGYIPGVLITKMNRGRMFVRSGITRDGFAFGQSFTVKPGSLVSVNVAKF